MQYFFDTNIFLRVLIKENEKQFAECSDLLGKVSSGEVGSVISDIVLSEVAWVLRSYYKRPRGEVVKSINGIYKFGFKYENGFDTKLAIELFSDSSAKYIDCLIASIPEIRNKKWTVVSYDRDFDKLGVKRMEPRQVLDILGNGKGK